MNFDATTLGATLDVAGGQAFLAEMKEVTESLKEVQQVLRERFTTVKTLADEWQAIPERELTIAVAHAEACGQAVEGACKAAGERLEATLEQSATQLGAHFDSFVDETRGQFQVWEAVHVEFGNACEGFLAQCRSSVEAAAQDVDGFRAEVENLQAVLAETAQHNTQRFETIRQTLTGQWTGTMESSGRAFIDELVGPHTQRAVEHFNSSREQFEQLRSALEQGLKDYGTDLDDELRNAMDEVGRHLETRMRDGLQDAADRVLDAAVQRITQEIFQGIVMSNIGAQTTTAMSPIVPHLIVIKHVADALREAIRIWKELKSGFGLFG